MLDVAGDFRARADEAHFSAQHIPELREFIQFSAPQEPAKSSDARVVIAGDGGAARIGIGNHGAKLPDKEGNTELADSALPVKDGSTVAEFQNERQQKKDRAEHD